MPLVFAAVVPHSPVLVPSVGKEHLKKLKKTVAAMKRLEQDLYASHPDTILIVSPHGPVEADHFTLDLNETYACDLKDFGVFDVDVACRADHQASLADSAGEFVWSGRRFRTTPSDLEQLWAKVPDGAEVTVVLEPTRNAWVLLAAWLQAKGATVVMVPPEQSADLRNYYNKHTKTDRLDSRVLARLPLLHPEGLKPIDSLGPADPLKRAVRHRSSLVKRRSASMLRLDALVELLGPAYADVLGAGDYNKTGLSTCLCKRARSFRCVG